MERKGSWVIVSALFEELRSNDGVGDAGFIFEADEDESLRGAGPLTQADPSAMNVQPISGLRQAAHAKVTPGSRSRIRAMG